MVSDGTKVLCNGVSIGELAKGPLKAAAEHLARGEPVLMLGGHRGDLGFADHFAYAGLIDMRLPGAAEMIRASSMSGDAFIAWLKGKIERAEPIREAFGYISSPEIRAMMNEHQTVRLARALEDQARAGGKMLSELLLRATFNEDALARTAD